MKRVALLAGAGVLAAVLFYAFHANSTVPTEPGSERKVDGTHAVRSAAPTAPSLTGEAPAVKTPDVAHANVQGLAEPLEPGYLAIEHAAKTCYLDRPAPTPIRPNGPDETIETIQLSYRQVSDHGIGRVENLEVAHGGLTDQALQSCITRGAAAATWNSNTPDGVIGELEQNVNLGDLMRPDYGLPPESKRSPKPTAPPPPELAHPLGQQAAADSEETDDHPAVIVSEPGLAKQPK